MHSVCVTSMCLGLRLSFSKLVDGTVGRRFFILSDEALFPVSFLFGEQIFVLDLTDR